MKFSGWRRPLTQFLTTKGQKEKKIFEWNKTLDQESGSFEMEKS